MSFIQTLWWPIYLIQFMEYFLWTWFNKYLLTMLNHHSLQLISGITTGAALSAFLSWLAHMSDNTVVSLLYSGISAYALGHSLCGLLYYIHVLKRPSLTINPPPTFIQVLSPAGYTGTFLGLYIFSFWMKFPLDPLRSVYWAAIVFPCLAVGMIAQHSGAYEVQAFQRPYKNRTEPRRNKRGGGGGRGEISQDGSTAYSIGGDEHHDNDDDDYDEDNENVAVSIPQREDEEKGDERDSYRRTGAIRVGDGHDKEIEAATMRRVAEEYRNHTGEDVTKVQMLITEH
jgi:hypothetical protein